MRQVSQDLPPRHPSMHSSWWEHRGACVTDSSRVGLFVGSKLLAAVKAHQAPNMLEPISEQTLCRLFSINWWGCAQQIVDVFDRWYLARVTLTISKNDNLWYLGHGLAGPVQALMSWRVVMGSIGRPPRTTKIWRMEREGSNCKSTLKLLNFSAIGPQWVVSHPKWDLRREVESRVFTNLDHIYWTGWIYIAGGAHRWYQI